MLDVCILMGFALTETVTAALNIHYCLFLLFSSILFH